ncbi:MAG: DNA double-strand break repair nuclease NurA [Thermoactinomyces sp.]
MLPVSEELKWKLKKLNDSLREVYPLAAFDKTKIRARLKEVGTFYQVEKWKDGEMKDWLKGKSVIGVDGSVNSTRGSQTRTLSVFQALAKGTLGEEKWAADVYTPLLEEEEEEGQAAREARKRGAILSALEMRVAGEAMREWEARVVIMDGSLLHFYIDDAEEWGKLAKTAEERGIFIVGVAEEISTRRLVKELFPEFPAWSDRDLLYGVLNVGEVFEWEDWSPAGSGMWKMAFRSSKSPQPIGLDGLMSQKEDRLALVRLVYSLTPEQGRGIPFWLDIVDNQVRVTNPLVETMVEQYIDADLRHRLLAVKRSDRMI